METIALNIDNKVATVTLDRPDVLNALNRKMLEELWSISTKLSESAVHVVVIRGEGRAFSAGADINEFGGPESRRPCSTKLCEDFTTFTTSLSALKSRSLRQ